MPGYFTLHQPADRSGITSSTPMPSSRWKLKVKPSSADRSHAGLASDVPREVAQSASDRLRPRTVDHSTPELRCAAKRCRLNELSMAMRSFFDGLDTTLLEVLEVIVHFLELFGGVTLPLRNLADDAEWAPGTV